MDINDVLAAIPTTEPATFNKFCNGLPEQPSERKEWAAIFNLISTAERLQLVEVSRLNNRIDSLQLTELGAERVREKQQHDRSRNL